MVVENLGSMVRLTIKEVLELMSYLQNTVPKFNSGDITVDDRHESVLVKRGYELEEMLAKIIKVDNVCYGYVDIDTLEVKKY